MKKLGKWLIDKWLGGFLAGLAILLLKTYIELPPEKRGGFFTSIRSVLNGQISVMSLLIVSAIFISIYLLIKVLKKKGKRLKPAPHKEFLSYRRDVFGSSQLQWSWKYEWDPLNQEYSIIELAPLCPKCSVQVETGKWGTLNEAWCPKCRLEGKQSYFNIREQDSDVQKEIIRRINSGEYKKNS